MLTGLSFLDQQMTLIIIDSWAGHGGVLGIDECRVFSVIQNSVLFLFCSVLRFWEDVKQVLCTNNHIQCQCLSFNSYGAWYIERGGDIADEPHFQAPHEKQGEARYVKSCDQDEVQIVHVGMEEQTLSD